MKEKFTDEIKNLFAQSKDWIQLEIEYAKLTLAEKFTMLFAMLVIGAVCLLLGMVVLILFSFALVEVFKIIMAPALAYLATGGVICVLILCLYLFRRPVLLNPIARYITKLFIDKN